MSPTSQVCGARSPLQTSDPGTSPTCNFFPAGPPLPTFSVSCPCPTSSFTFFHGAASRRSLRSAFRGTVLCMTWLLNSPQHKPGSTTGVVVLGLRDWY